MGDAVAHIDSTRRLKQAALLLGFSLGGFFDGILLHQVLQWHHLLSNVQAAALQDLRAQVLADGLFHALMYVIATIALARLWGARRGLAQPGAGRLLQAWALIGFGVWHVVDGVLSHWITGIHRVKVDSSNPLAWDLFWFAAFGVVPLVAGWRMKRSEDGCGGGGTHAATALALAALVAGPVAALPSGDASRVLVLFMPRTSPSAAFNALAEVDARILWVDRSGGMWAVQLKDATQAKQLHGKGALLVSNSFIGVGCFGWSRPPG